jgi:UTP--glucose-1-phosphate uridylyltransferase
MLPASLYMPKETMPLIDTPIINHLIWEAARSGVTRIHLVLSQWKMDILSGFISGGYSVKDDIRTDLPRISLGLGTESVELIPHIQESALGVADAISQALPSIRGPFLVILGDNLVTNNHPSPMQSGVENASSASLELVESFQQTGLATVGVCKVGKEELSKYGVVEIVDESISKIVEKPSIQDAPSNYVLSGRYLFPENTGELLEMYPVSDFGEFQSIKLLEHFIDNGGLGVVKYDDFKIFDSGEPVTWLKSQILHALLRNDLSATFSEWLRDVLQDTVDS